MLLWMARRLVEGSDGGGSTVDALRLDEVCRSREQGMLGELPANPRRC